MMKNKKYEEPKIAIGGGTQEKDGKHQAGIVLKVFGKILMGWESPFIYSTEEEANIACEEKAGELINRVEELIKHKFWEDTTTPTSTAWVHSQVGEMH